MAPYYVESVARLIWLCICRSRHLIFNTLPDLLGIFVGKIPFSVRTNLPVAVTYNKSHLLNILVITISYLVIHTISPQSTIIQQIYYLTKYCYANHKELYNFCNSVIFSPSVVSSKLSKESVIKYVDSSSR